MPYNHPLLGEFRTSGKVVVPELHGRISCARA